MEDLSIKDAEGHSAKVTSLSENDLDTLNALIGVVNNLSGSATATRNLDELVYSISPLEDSSLHLADGDTITSTGIYSRYYAKKLADYNKAPTVANARQYGSLTNTNGVYSGFSNSAYIKSVLPFKPTNNSWEIKIKFTTGSNFAYDHSVFSSLKTQSVSVSLISTRKFLLALSSNNSSWDLSTASGTYSVLDNTTYYLKIAFDGSKYTLKYSLDGITYITDITVTSSTPIYQANNVLIGWGASRKLDALAFISSIDFKETSITIGAGLWWSGAIKRGFTNEAYWQAMVATYGSCGKFVINTTNETIRLPKLTGFLEGTTSLGALSELTKAGLPGISGRAAGATSEGWVNFVTDNNSGAFYSSNQQTSCSGGAAAGTGNATLLFDASRSSPIYGNSPTVQPQSISVYVYIVLASVIKTDITVDIDNVATDLNTKASKSLDNITDSAKVMMAKASMPSNRYVDLSQSAINTVDLTAPADGYAVCQAQMGGNGDEVRITNNTSGLIGYSCGTGGRALSAVCPCKKGDGFYTYCGGSISQMLRFRFIYAEGSKNE